ncbi:MAG: hypothetical protein US49_C0005G0016 [candidate division TM6 bacterium GW2011_GWF2_37_49]|nr:MAG: hypothetical protein US49_C0005G0016 [candidate division TM6 bacterium GW2011_GWF2_37_49]
MDKIFCKNKTLILLFLFSSCLADASQVAELESASAAFDSLDVSSFANFQRNIVLDEDYNSGEETGLDLNDSFSVNSYSKSKRSKFYKTYIAKYYPKAYVIQEKFLKMTVDEVAASLNDIIYVFVKEPWFYFQNTRKGFRLIYFWEYIIDQLAILHDFLMRARVDKKTKKIFWPNEKPKYNFWSNFSSFSADPNSYALSDYLKEHFINVYADFYALSFDYHVKMFNEGVLLKKINQANRYIYEIDYILNRLKSTPKDADYAESRDTCKQVLGVLRKKLGYDNYMNSFNGNAAGQGVV